MNNQNDSIQMEEKKLKEAEKRVNQYIADGIIKAKGKSEHTAFFLKNADDSIDSAKALFEKSDLRKA